MDDEVGLRLWLSKDTTIGNADDVLNDDDTATLDDGPIAPGDTQEAITPLGECPAGIAPGNYYVAITLDYDKQVPETNETNNFFITAAPVITVIDQAYPTDSVHGSEGNDTITLEEGGVDVISFNQVESQFFVRLNGTPWYLQYIYESGHPLFIDSAGGNDKVVAGPLIDFPLLITGSGGNDTIVGGNNYDSVSGANGKDKIFGGDGDDKLLGAAGNDYVNGEDGNDVCSGAGGNDRLVDLFGSDYLLGGSGNDVFVSRDLDGNFVADDISGGPGTDRAQLDANDGRASIEELLA
jgi:Ca2+-binding RTX toxin-like protein